MNCRWFEKVDEHLALGVPVEFLPAALREHLDGCSACRTQAEESLTLNRLLQEPLGLPPADLAERVLAAVAVQPRPRAADLSWGERFLWAGVGAVSALGASAWWESGSSALSLVGDALARVGEFSVPLGLDSTVSLTVGLSLLAVQTAVILGVRRAEAVRG